MLNYDNFDAILFDMDGTIFDSETVHREAWKRTANQFGQTFTNDMYLQFIGMVTPDCMQLAMKMFNNEIELKEFSNCYYKNLNMLVQTGVPLKAGFKTYLEKVVKMNKALGIVTSSAMSGVQSNFLHYDFLSVFDIVMTRDDVERFKPHPEPYILACKKLNVMPNRTLVFEDSNTGATSALDADCYTIGIPDLVPFEPITKSRLHLTTDSFENLQ